MTAGTSSMKQLIRQKNFKKKTPFDESKYNDLQTDIIKIENSSSHELDFTIKQSRIRLFGSDYNNIPSFNKDNLATYLQDIKNKITELKDERKRYEQRINGSA